MKRKASANLISHSRTTFFALIARSLFIFEATSLPYFIIIFGINRISLYCYTFSYSCIFYYIYMYLYIYPVLTVVGLNGTVVVSAINIHWKRRTASTKARKNVTDIFIHTYIYIALDI